MPVIETSQVIRTNNEGNSLRTTIPISVLAHMKLKRGDFIEWERRIIKDSESGKVCNCIMLKKREPKNPNSNKDICSECGENNWIENENKGTTFCRGCGHVRGDL